MVKQLVVSTVAALAMMFVFMGNEAQAADPDHGEPNDDAGSATPVECGDSIIGAFIAPIGDLDFYSIPLSVGTRAHRHDAVSGDRRDDVPVFPSTLRILG